MVRVLYEDGQMVVCVKPAGVLSQDGGGGSLPAQLRAQLSSEIYPVHRLDRETGGVIVYGRTRAAAAKLSEAMQAGRFEKRYLCIVQGEMEAEEGEYRDLLVHDKARNKGFVVKTPRGGAKEAILCYRVLEVVGGASVLQVRIETGRTHQIRVQLSSRGHPVLGDSRYGGGTGELALWSWMLAFPRPSDGEEIRLTAPPEGGVWDAYKGQGRTFSL